MAVLFSITFLVLYCLLEHRISPALVARGFATVFLVDAAVLYLAGTAGASFSRAHAIAVIAGGIACLLVGRLRIPAGVTVRRPFSAPTLLFPLGAFLILLWVARRSLTLPGHDPVLIPTFARFFAIRQTFPWSLSPVSTLIPVYPPGFSLVLAQAMELFRPITVLWCWKMINLGAIALTPLTWGGALGRILRIRDERMPLLIGAFYWAFFAFDRSLLLAPAYAGKNAQILASCLFPLVLERLLESRRGIVDLAVTGLMVTGLVIGHYSALVMLAIGLAATVVVERLPLRRVLNIAMVLGIAVVLLVPVFLRLREGGLVSATGESLAIPDRLRLLVSLVGDSRSPFFFIFNEVGESWPFKGLLCLVMTLGVVLVRFHPPASLREDDDSTAWSRGGLVMAIALLLSLLVAVRLIPVGGTGIEYVRWFAYNFIAGLAACSLLLFLRVIRHPPARWVLPLVLAVLPAHAGLVGLHDASWLARSFDEQAVGRDQLETMAAVLESATDSGAIDLVTDSLLLRNGYYTVQKHRPLEYAYAIVGCRIVNGMWAIPGLPGSRTDGGLPAWGFFRFFGRSPLVMIGPTDRLEPYFRRSPGLTWHTLESPLFGESLYRVTFTGGPGRSGNQPQGNPGAIPGESPP